MDFVANVIDYGDVKDTFVSGFSRVTRISNGNARIALYVETEGAEGVIERRVVAHIVCDIAGLASGYAEFAKAVEAIETAAPLNGRRVKERAGAH